MNTPPNATPTPTLAFDIYGTLIDTAGVTSVLEKHLGAADAAAEFSTHWRTKQLEYTFRYASMAHYRDFRVCTRQALDFCCASLHADFSEATREDLMAQYLRLPAFSDVVAGLDRLAQARLTMYAFSNGRADDLEQLLTHAGIRHYFADIISVDEISTFKPNPAVYHHFLERAATNTATKITAEESWLISSNAFDVCGARSIGMQAVWMRRNPAMVFDPWEFAPTHEIASFAEMVELFTAD